MCPLSAEGSSHAPPTVWASFREFAEAERKSRINAGLDNRVVDSSLKTQIDTLSRQLSKIQLS